MENELNWLYLILVALFFYRLLIYGCAVEYEMQFLNLIVINEQNLIDKNLVFVQVNENTYQSFNTNHQLDLFLVEFQHR